MRTRSNVEKFILTGMVAGGLALGAIAGASALPLSGEVGCRLPGLINAAASENVADTFVIPFAANSSDLTPVAEEVLDAAAAAYPQKGTLFLRIEGGEPKGQTETMVSMDRLTWVTAYLTARDVPLEAMVFEAPAVAQMGCATTAASL